MREEQIVADASVVDAGNDDAAEAGALVGRYREPLRRYFERRLRNRADAEDLAQDVLVRLTRQRLLVRQTRPAYIFLTARSVLLDHVRRSQVRARSHPYEPEETAQEVPSAERVCTEQERVERVAQLIAQLTPRARQVFVMHRVEGLSYSEIAQALEITLGTVEKHVSAALLFLVQHRDEIEG